MKRLLSTILPMIFLLGILVPTVIVAQEAASEVAAAVVEAAPAQPEVGIGQIMQDTVKAFSDWKMVGWQLGLAALITALISTMKNSFLRGLLWDKVPNWLKLFMAPLLSLLAFVLMSGQGFSAPVVLAAITTGIGSQYLHEMLDALKGAPFVGSKWQWVVDVLGSLLKAPKQ